MDSTTSAWSGPLRGIRVLDFTRILAGPSAALALADLGAEVIKVERPVSGDDTRAWPPYAKDTDGVDTSVSSYYLAANRGKKSIAIDIASAEGQRVVKALAMESDVVIENYKVGQLARYGLDYASLAKDKPSLIYCSVTLCGQTGPHRDKPGHDPIALAISGALSRPM